MPYVSKIRLGNTDYDLRASSLIGDTQAVSAEFTSRTAGGSSGIDEGVTTAIIQRIKGNTIVSEGQLLSFLGTGISTGGTDWTSILTLPGKENFVVSYTAADGTTKTASGLKSAGTAYDEQTATKDIRRIDVVDLGNFSYSLNNSVFIGPANTFSGLIASDRQYVVALPYTHYPSGSYSSMPDKSIFIRSSDSRLFIKDTAYSSASTFKAAMAGQLLFYERATPVETTVSPRLMSYRVEKGGTEAMQPSQGSTPTSAPISLDVIYGNTADVVQALPQNYMSLGVFSDFLAALGTAMGGTWSMVYDNGRYTFTFTSN